jgi:hypothetical protein
MEKPMHNRTAEQVLDRIYTHIVAARDEAYSHVNRSLYSPDTERWYALNAAASLVADAIDRLASEHMKKPIRNIEEKPLTPEQKKERARQIRSLVEDGGWNRREAAELVDAGFGETPERNHNA